MREAPRGSASSWRTPALPGGVILLTVTLVLTGALAREPLDNPVGGALPPDVSLAFPTGYLLLAPLAGIFDTLSLLTVGQHIGFLVSVLLVYLAWRITRGREGHSWWRIAAVEAAGVTGLLLTILGVYAAGVFVPRPMAFLRVSDPDVLLVDFHSHTNRSHDGRNGFSAGVNREWHRGGGFDVAYVTDHTHVDTALAAAARNPVRAGDGTLMLAGREYIFQRQHVVQLDAHDPSAPGASPVLIQTLPNDLSRVPVPGPDGRGGVVAIEIVDAAPRGLAQIDRERLRILAVADSLELALIAASNNHGWGWTAAAWSLMRIPDWRAMSPEQLARAIPDQLASKRREAVQVVERSRVHESGPPISFLLSGPRLAVHLLLTLTWPERLSWILWILGLHALGVLIGRSASMQGTRRLGENPSQPASHAAA